MKLFVRLAAVAALPLGFATGAAAQDRGEAPGRFDFYVLALSWSPGFCETSGSRRHSAQCEPGRRLGFVVHGLWPQNERGYPSECGSERPAPRYALDEARGIYPDMGLARHEWRMHGTCTGLAPTAYFASVRRAREKISIPEPLSELARDGETTPQNIERAFATANPGLRPDMMAVTCRRGRLQEVRICMTRDLSKFRRCPEIDRAACHFGPIRVTAPH